MQLYVGDERHVGFIAYKFSPLPGYVNLCSSFLPLLGRQHPPSFIAEVLLPNVFGNQVSPHFLSFHDVSTAKNASINCPNKLTFLGG